MLRVLIVFGTRPEAIKMAPVVKELQKHPQRVQARVCITAQHREMLDQVLKLFGIQPDIDLNLMLPEQQLPDLTARVISGMSQVLARERPDCVLIQGDTTTVMATALAAFYQRIPVGHVEAGLRTRNRYNPFPEEINRRMVSVLATYHFAPTQTAVDALLAEGVSADSVFLTGNTVVDALLWVVRQPPSRETRALFDRLGIGQLPANGSENVVASPSSLVNSRRLILVTAHRRENFGDPFEEMMWALRHIVEHNADVELVYPVHLNPNVQEPAHRILGAVERVHLMEPLDYLPFAHLMKHAYLVLTDSGGIQEEAPALGVPVLVMRRETERPEAVEAGTAKLVGTDHDVILQETERLLRDPLAYQQMAQAVSPYGDGHAAERIVSILLE